MHVAATLSFLLESGLPCLRWMPQRLGAVNLAENAEAVRWRGRYVARLTHPVQEHIAGLASIFTVTLETVSTWQQLGIPSSLWYNFFVGPCPGRI